MKFRPFNLHLIFIILNKCWYFSLKISLERTTSGVLENSVRYLDFNKFAFYCFSCFISNYVIEKEFINRPRNMCVLFFNFCTLENNLVIITKENCGIIRTHSIYEHLLNYFFIICIAFNLIYNYFAKIENR